MCHKPDDSKTNERQVWAIDGDDVVDGESDILYKLAATCSAVSRHESHHLILRDKDLVVVIMGTRNRTPCHIFLARSETVYGQVCIAPVTSNELE
jgi:hypothetical protein